MRADKKTERRDAGFSLMELMVTVLLVSLLALTVGGGVTVVQRAYRAVTLRANAQTLLSSTITAMQEKLRYADVKAGRDSLSNDPEKGICIDGIPVVTEATSGKEFVTAYTGEPQTDEAAGTLTVEIRVSEKESGESAAGPVQLTIRSLQPVR
ncbi:PulJ/GspJ family protein [Lachnoclostridium sp. Marseille-P6806]|uniref:PulJ/GspJ family protein n=1 Tax=Lachnoclostridium sp. Marseille-P6806 TaxID=2364793 RepID=UPI00102FDB9A|nr:prepilin-type N-terminal cleavage/methylation domain-containing protein [Lachnoclostridium sp. Marseille-P6806]